MKSPLFLLASSSPRRRELLSGAGYRFRVLVPAIDETFRRTETPVDMVRRLAREKARAVIAKYNATGHVVLAADTTVVLDGQILGKPASNDHAVRLLRQLSGCEHEVFTAIAVTDGVREKVRSVRTRVRFFSHSRPVIEKYVLTGEPMDKAGGYAIQGAGAFLIEKISGSYTNVIGLPMAETARMLAAFGVLPG
ncbi:MAG: septum formation inhibitor Maf [Deltaproteobacteria bacterium]|nr:septum formation inhibitor Maf [Deltaproteobacteria bacterium]